MPFDGIKVSGFEQFDRIAALLDVYPQRAAEVSIEYAEQFMALLVEGYEAIGSVDVPSIKETHPHFYLALRNEASSLGKHLLLKIDTDSGQFAKVYFDPEATMRSGVRVLDLALLIEYGIADRGIPAFQVFHKALEQMRRG